MEILENNSVSKTDLAASTHLGKKSAGSELYDSGLLVAVPRLENRSHYGIKNDDLPFVGYDVWHAYEFSAMTKKGLPVTRVLKLKYNATSEFIVESKSLKLYLNSFNMTRLGENISECLSLCKSMIEKDLSAKLEAEVLVEFLDNDAEKSNIFSQFVNVLNFVDENSLSIEAFKEAPELLKVYETKEKQDYYLKFDSLRSNCRVTHQPDFGDVYIHYSSKKHIDEASLVQYLVSFRSEYHFHEECCEMIYKRLLDLLDKEDELFVCALYTRRGGIDITPVRWNKAGFVEDAEKILDLSTFARSGIKQ